MNPTNTNAAGKTPFQLVLIKPTHYDDDGYVIQWFRSSIPANSLASVYGVAQDAAQFGPLAGQIDLHLTALDEANTRIQPKKIIKQVRRIGGHVLIGLVGVQTNQFPRATEIARQFRDAGLNVMIGGFHVSGCLAMLKELPADIKAVQDMGVSLYAGELEGRIEEVLQDTMNGTLKPLYNYMHDLPDMENASVPFMPADRVNLTMGKRSSFDAGRGCPYLCSFCTIINVQGRKSRWRSADDVEKLVRQNSAQGVSNFFITDDNFARNRNWEEIFDRLIALKAEGLEVYLILQVDTMAHKIKGFMEKAGKAGVTRVFIGMENINPDSLKTARKGQNRITEYRAMLQAWHAVGALTYAGYILGFPGDTPETIRRDIEIIKRELPVDILEFFCLTPLPGSQDHKELTEAGVPLDPDMNNYDLQHVCRDHEVMTRSEWQGIYREAWDIYYSDEHVETVLRRAKVWGYDSRNMLAKLFAFHAPIVYEKMHPLEGGLFRRKYRKDRRPGFPIENPLVFYPKLFAENIWKYTGGYRLHRHYKRIWQKVENDANAGNYTDIAMQPVREEDLDELEMYHVTEAAEQAANKIQRHHTPPAVAATEVQV